MAKIIFEKKIEVTEHFNYLTSSTKKIKAILYSDKKIYFECDIMKVTLKPSTATYFSISGKGSRIHKHLIDKAIEVFLIELRKNGIKYDL